MKLLCRFGWHSSIYKLIEHVVPHETGGFVIESQRYFCSRCDKEMYP